MTPTGEIVAIPLRGAWLGNRGILHRDTEVKRFHASQLWIVCELEHKDHKAAQWEPHHYTVLFFHDEAVALAAGHRPCAYCRRAAYNAYRTAWSKGLGVELPLAPAIDHQLHGERIFRGTHQRRYHDAKWAEAPVGSFAMHEGHPVLVLETSLVPWTESGYGSAVPRPLEGVVSMITPPSTVAVLRAGYHPQIDDSALAHLLHATP